MRIRTIWFPQAAAAVVAIVTLLPVSVAATVAIRLPLPSMVRSADLIIEGRVLDFDARRGTTAQGPMCPALDLRYTDITVDVDQVYKGRISDSSVIVRVFGGRAGGNGILRETFLPFRRGERVLLFLQMNGSDDFPFVGFHQGLYRFRSSGPNRTMPNLDLRGSAGACPRCVPIVVDGRDHLITGYSGEGYLETLPASRLPQFHLVVGPGENVPPEPDVPSGGVIPRGTRLPAQIARPATVRDRIRMVLRTMGLPAPSALGDPGAPLANELRPGDPIVRCGTLAVPNHDPEDVPVPDTGPDPPIVPGPSEPPRRRPGGRGGR